MTYSALKTKIEGYFNRGDTSSKVAGWIELAESFLFREIRSNTIEDSVTGTATETIPLPADFSSLLRIDLDYSGRIVTLDYTTQGSGFVVEGNTVRLVNQHNQSFAYTLYYSPRLTALSNSNTTNWLLENGFDLYFYASVLEGARALKNDGEINRAQSVIPVMLESVKSYANRSKYPTAGSMRIRPRSAV